MKDELTREEIKKIKAAIEKIGALRVSILLGPGRLAIGNALMQLKTTHPATIACIRANIGKLDG